MSDVLQEGAVFASRYKVLRRIAGGGMGSVYEVVHIETNRRRALKVMHPHVLQSDDMRERFKREARIAADVESEFIVDVFDAGIDEATGMPFLVMELLRGEELGKRLKRLGPLSPAEVTQYLHQTALALDKTHRASIVHRDLKPENLFLTEREDGPPRVKVLDFGIAKILAEGPTNGAAATQSLGTPLYMSPEQFNPRLKLSGASDIFSLGMMAYTLLVGKAYWAEEAQASNLYAFVSSAAHGPSEPASVRAAALGVWLSSDFDAWFAKATAAKPEDRFATATAAVRALAEALGTLPAAGASPTQSDGSLPGSGLAESGPQRQVLLSGPDLAAPSAPTAALTPGLAPARPALGAASSSGTIPLHTADLAAPPRQAPPHAVVPPAPLPTGPETTSPGASVTRPIPPERSKPGRLAALAGVVVVACALGYWVISRGPSAPTLSNNGTLTSPSATIAPAGSPSIPAQVGSASEIKTETSPPDAGALPSATSSTVAPSPSASTAPSASRPAGNTGRRNGPVKQRDPDVGF